MVLGEVDTAISRLRNHRISAAMKVRFLELSEAVELDRENSKENEETHEAILNKGSQKHIRIVFNNGGNLTDKSLTLKFLF
jgi:hypothetical protein